METRKFAVEQLECISAEYLAEHLEEVSDRVNRERICLLIVADGHEPLVLCPGRIGKTEGADLKKLLVEEIMHDVLKSVYKKHDKPQVNGE